MHPEHIRDEPDIRLVRKLLKTHLINRAFNVHWHSGNSMWHLECTYFQHVIGSLKCSGWWCWGLRWWLLLIHCRHWRQQFGNFGGWTGAQGKVSWVTEVTQWGQGAKTPIGGLVDEPPKVILILEMNVKLIFYGGKIENGNIVIPRRNSFGGEGCILPSPHGCRLPNFIEIFRIRRRRLHDEDASDDERVTTSSHHHSRTSDCSAAVWNQRCKLPFSV